MSRINRSTLKALDVLEILASEEEGLTLSDLSEQTGYPISTAHRLLASLLERDYVEQDPQTKRYHLGVRILTLQTQGIRGRSLGRLAYPHLNRLKQRVEMTLNLGVLSGTDVIYIETFSPDSSLSFYSPPGTRMPSYCTAIGKLLLSCLPPENRENLLAMQELRKRTPHTITSLPALQAVFTEIDRRGYALDDQEYAIGVRCLAAPIRNHRGKVIAGVSMTSRIELLPDEQIEPMAGLLTETCFDISKALGYQYPL